MSKSGFNPSGPRLPVPCLMLVTERHLAGGEDRLVEMVAQAVDGGVNVVQLREKDLPPRELLPLARRLRQVTAGRAILLVNGPLRVALACGADGVHLPAAGPRRFHPVAQGPSPEPGARSSAPLRGLLLGRSVHSVAAALRAQSEGADYVVAGPVYETHSHPGAPGAGPRLIEAVAAAVAMPVIAIGGVTAGRVDEVVRAGASGVAVITAVLAAPSPRDAARGLRVALDAAFQPLTANLQPPQRT